MHILRKAFAALILLIIIGGCADNPPPPKVEISLTDIRLMPPDDRWEPHFRLEGVPQPKEGAWQLEVDLETSNDHQYRLPFFGIYSKRLSAMALGVQDLTLAIGPIASSIGAYSTRRDTIYYLIKDKDRYIIDKIEPEKDFVAYTSHGTLMLADHGEKIASSRKARLLNTVFSSFVPDMPNSEFAQIGLSKAIDARSTKEFVARLRQKQAGKPQTGKVVIMSVPRRCEVSFFNESVRKATDQIILEGIPAGIHPIIFKFDDETLKTKIEVIPDQILEVKGHFELGEILLHMIKPGPKKVDKIGKDGAPMVLIPAGEFQMGGTHGDELPVHTVYVDAFYMDIYEVTNAQYKKFIDATGYRIPRSWHHSLSHPEHCSPDRPVVCVSWEDAMAYCKWAGKRLPTEAEWEKAARGGLIGKKYPWGDSLIYDNFSNYRDKKPVGNFPPNGYGLYDMTGNVWEWCADGYDENYYSISPKRNPKCPRSRASVVVRGGLRVASRSSGYYDSFTNGFRCVENFIPTP